MPGAETISSAANPLVKEVRRAITRGVLTGDGLCVAETFHLLEEAVRSNCEIRTVLAAESARAAVDAQLGKAAGVKVIVLPDVLLRRVSDTQTSQGVIALVKPPSWSVGDLFRGRPLLMVLDGVQDPGNAGTIVRTAEAFGATGAIFLKGSVSPFNPKTLRASAGSLFRLPFLYGVDPSAARTLLRDHDVQTYAAVPSRSATPASAPADIGLGGKTALVVGRESRGIGAEWLATAQPVSIPTAGVESLNAAVAAGILLYEASRQRARRA